MNNIPNYPNTENIPPCFFKTKNKYTYTTTHGIFALLTFILASLWYRWIFISHQDNIFGNFRALGITVFTLLFFTLTISFFKFRKKDIGKDALIIMCASLVFSARFILYPDDTGSLISFLTIILLHICALLFLYCIGTKNSLDKIVGSTMKCIFIQPFASFHRIFVSFSAFLKLKNPYTNQEKEKSKKVLINISLVLLTLFCIIPIISAVLSLLFSDGFFSDFLSGVYDFLSEINIDLNFGDYFNLITILVSMYIFGAIFSADIKTDKPATPAQNYSVIPLIMSKTVFFSLIIIYAIFTIAQIDGFTHMFLGILPDGITYAEFARSGFFELCAVACINGGVLFLLDILTIKDKSGKMYLSITIILIIFTILLIFTAAAKMIMYISAYGFTPKRFYTLWFMLLLTVLFIMSIIKFKKTTFKLSRFSVYSSLIFFAVLFLVDFDSISCYLNSTLQF